MNRLLLTAFVAALMLPATGVAQTAAHTPTGKIGWISIDLVVTTCDEGARTINDIQKFIDDKNNQLDTMRRDYDDLRNRLEVQASRLTDEARMDLEEKAVTQEVALQRFSEDTQRDIDFRRQRLYNTISGKLGPVFEKVAADMGLDAIQVFDPQRDAWIHPDLNVTENVIKAYNQTYPANAPIMPSAAKKP